MYQVSQAYQTAETKAVKQFKARGVVCGQNFTADDILKGSLTISQQATSPTEITLGSVYIGQLNATFVGMNIARNSWVGGTITLQVGLKLASGLYEYVPVGTYNVAVSNTSLGKELLRIDFGSLLIDLTSFKPVHPSKAEPISPTDLGMLMDVRPVQPVNELESIIRTPSGTTVFLQPVTNMLLFFSIMALQLSRESYVALPLSTTILVKPLQLMNGLPP